MESSYAPTILLSALVGVIVSLPTGPTEAYIVSLRMTQGVPSMLAGILVIVIINHLYIMGILEGRESIQQITESLWIVLVFCLVILGLGIYKVMHPLVAAREKQLDSSLQRLSNSVAGSAVVAGIINALNPMLVVSLASLLTTFGLNSGTHETWPTILGFSIGCVGLWTTIGIFLQHSLKYAQDHLRIIIQGCGVLMIISAMITLVTVLTKLL